MLSKFRCRFYIGIICGVVKNSFLMNFRAGHQMIAKTKTFILHLLFLTSLKNGEFFENIKEIMQWKAFFPGIWMRFVCATQIQQLFISRFLFTLIHFGFLHTINLKQEENEKNFSNFDFSLSFVCLFQFLFLFLSQSRTKIVIFYIFFCTILKESLINFRMFHWQKKEEFMNLGNILWRKRVGNTFGRIFQRKRGKFY